jgi:hypothetical protein
MNVTSYHTQSVRADIGTGYRDAKWIDLIIEDDAGEITITLHLKDSARAEALVAAINSTNKEAA